MAEPLSPAQMAELDAADEQIGAAIEALQRLGVKGTDAELEGECNRLQAGIAHRRRARGSPA
jgi:hypothetical protein